MNVRKPQLTLLAFLVLVIAGAAIASILGGHKSKSAVKKKELKTVVVKKNNPRPVPSLGQPTDTEGQPDQERAGEIAGIRRTRMHPTPRGMKKLLTLINKDKDPAVLSEAMNTLGVLAQKGIDSEQTYKLLSQKALEKDFPSRGEALLITSILGKDKALAVVSAFLQGAQPQDAAMLGWASRSLNMIATPASVPLIEKLISQTSDPDVRGPSYDALAKAGTPEAFAFLKQQAQTTSGKDQAYSAAALSQSKDPETRSWIENAIEDGLLGRDAISTIAMMPAAPDILGKVLTAGGLSASKQLDILRLIAPAMQGNPNLQKLAVALAPLVYSGDVKVQKEALQLVGKAGGSEVSAIIQPLLTSEDPQVRRDAFFSYLKFTDADNYKYLFDFLNDRNPETRRMAMFMLGKFYGPSDRSALEQAAQSDDAFIRDKAKQYLSSLN